MEAERIQCVFQLSITLAHFYKKIKKKVMAVASHRNDCDRTFACQAGQAAGLGSRWFQLWDVDRPVVICGFRVITSFHCKRRAVVYFKQ